MIRFIQTGLVAATILTLTGPSFAEQHSEIVLLRQDAVVVDGSGSYFEQQGNVIEENIWGLGGGSGSRYDLFMYEGAEIPQREIDTTYSFNEPPVQMRFGHEYLWDFNISISGVSKYTLNNQGAFGLVLLYGNLDINQMKSFRHLRVSANQLPLNQIGSTSNEWLYQGVASVDFSVPISAISPYANWDLTLAARFQSGPSEAIKAMVYWTYEKVEIPTGLPDPRVGTDAENPECSLATSYTENEITGFVNQLSGHEARLNGKISTLDALLQADDLYLLPFNIGGNVATLTHAELVTYAPDIRRMVLQNERVDLTLFGEYGEILQLAATALKYGMVSTDTADSQIVAMLMTELQPINERARVQRIAELVALRNELDSTRDMANKFITERERVRHYVQTGEVTCN